MSRALPPFPTPANLAVLRPLRPRPRPRPPLPRLWPASSARRRRPRQLRSWRPTLRVSRALRLRRRRPPRPRRACGAPAALRAAGVGPPSRAASSATTRPANNGVRTAVPCAMRAAPCLPVWRALPVALWRRIATGTPGFSAPLSRPADRSSCVPCVGSLRLLGAPGEQLEWEVRPRLSRPRRLGVRLCRPSRLHRGHLSPRVISPRVPLSPVRRRCLRTPRSTRRQADGR
jgi:hypothetical protein